ncbi:IS110 family transposase [Burkholderia pseudomallei]|nr:IS110 family transposase [Burkholderia pseudomallei]ABA52515.1 Transposase [Burkholderia pseudomallei 1710b]ABN95763.2 Transposase, IS116/IS110/IS902 family [Burkholderia pseudomallei 1106a]EDS86816.1 transposase, IS116/IS110/IS902 family [Burkholderia pseudomallei S13]EES22031.1 transposase, IS116/IS110/IS902 family [Burkholderia pseudomallei 1106b]EET02787.1 transposase IS116/IS110/IS902 family [Burkholderia pseudomallei 1710a]PNW90852.1 IS110 family transposase [Burkholderia sp. 136(201
MPRLATEVAGQFVHSAHTPMQQDQQHDSVDVFVGVDVGKGQHHAVALDRNGKRLYNKAMPNDEAKLRALISELRAHGRLLFVVDQPATIGALPVAIARDEGVMVAYLPGLAMRRIADLHAGEAKTDARDAAIIAEAARSMPHTLRSLRLADEPLAELTMLCGFDDDLAAQITQTSNRIRGLLTQIHPALERVLGPRLDHPAVLDLLERYPSPATLAAASEKTLANRLTKLAPRMGKNLAAEIVQALNEQAVIVPGTQAATIVMPRLAQQLAALRKQRDEVASEVERLVLAHPLWPVLTSMPGVGVRTAARLLTEVAHKAFASAAHLAAYAGLAPVTRRSGSSIRGEHPSRRGNKVLKRALFLSAFAALRDPISRAYYTRKVEQGKRHNQALIALARRRCDVLFAMLRDGTIYQPKAADNA